MYRINAFTLDVQTSDTQKVYIGTALKYCPPPEHWQHQILNVQAMQGWIPEDIIALSRIAGASPVRREIDVPCYHGNRPARENGCCSLPPLTTASSSPTHTEKKHGLCLIFSYEFSFFFSLCVVFFTIYHSQSSSEESIL